MKEEHFNALLEELQCQFLCCYPLHCIDWQKIPTDLTWEQQEELIQHTFAHPLNEQQPVKLSYQLNFLKRLLQLLEKHYTEVHDAVYESYCTAQGNVALDTTQKYAYKHYLLPAWKAQFTLRESKSFVAEGTTGLCSWQASLALADYLLHNVTLLQDKSVLELGAGTGLCGLLLARCTAARHILLTDGSRECVQLMCENICRNFADAKEITSGSYQIEATTLSAAQLSWGTIGAKDLPEDFTPALLLAADVVYDDSVFTQLTEAIDSVFQLRQNSCMMLLAATVRNEHTLQKFLDLLAALHFLVAEKETIPLAKSNLFWDRSTAVKIFEITRQHS